MPLPITIGYMANIALGCALLVFGGTMHVHRGRHAGNPLLGAFLALVGLNYLLDGSRVVVADVGHGAWSIALERAGLLVAAVDPAILMLFAWKEARRPFSRWGVGAILLPCFALAIAMPTAPPDSPWRLAYVAYLVGCYVAALRTLLDARLSSDDPVHSTRLDTLVLALGPPVLARIPLVYTDLGLVAGVSARAAAGTLIMDLCLLLCLAGTVATIRRHARRAEDARALILPIAALTGIVAIVWGLRFVPILQSTAFAFLYSIRWFPLVGVLSTETARERIFAVVALRTRHLRAVFVSLVVLTGALASSSILAHVTRISLVDALWSGAVLVASVTTIGLASRFALPPSKDALASRPASIYRARLDLGARPEEIHLLRLQLGISERVAREVEALAALESTLAAGARIEPGVTLLGRYRVERVIGIGSFGRVWAARAIDGRKVVIKELREEWHDDPTCLRGFVREIEHVMRISHPNLVEFRSLERIAHGFALVLSHVEGETLRARLARGPLGTGSAARLAADLSSALAALHERGLVHRDVKPENVVMTREGRAVLLDLGASVPQGRVMTIAHGAGGSVGYAAPEVVDGEATPRSDVYAAGLVVREALAGERARGGAIAGPWAAWLAKCLDPDPAERFASGREMLAHIPSSHGLRSVGSLR